jgi:NitT/TauT family transport system permease protein
MSIQEDDDRKHGDTGAMNAPIPDPQADAPAGTEAAPPTDVAARQPVTPKEAVGVLVAAVLKPKAVVPFVKSWSIRLIALAFGVLVWHVATETKFNYFINFENVPSPAKVWTAFVAHVYSTEFYIHIAVSMQRIFIGYMSAVGLGILLGLVIGRSRLARDVISPYIEILRPIPAVAWIPLAILMWPTEESSIIYITFLGALFPIILNTAHGAELTPDVLIRAAKSLGANRREIFWHVVIPAALPSITAGLAIGMGVSWFSLLAGEIISGQYGIGYFTWNAYSLINYPDIVVGMLMIGGLGTLSTYAVRLATRPLLSWQRRSR